MRPPLNLTTAERERWAYANGQTAAARNLGVLCDVKDANEKSADAIEAALHAVAAAVKESKASIEQLEGALEEAGEIGEHLRDVEDQ